MFRDVPCLQYHQAWPSLSDAWKTALFAPGPRPTEPLSPQVLQTLAARQFATMDIGNFTTPLAFVPNSCVHVALVVVPFGVPFDQDLLLSFIIVVHTELLV